MDGNSIPCTTFPFSVMKMHEGMRLNTPFLFGILNCNPVPEDGPSKLIGAQNSLGE